MGADLIYGCFRVFAEDTIRYGVEASEEVD
jgi:hypothetical protein